MRKLLNVLVLALILFSGSTIAIADENNSLNDLLSKPVDEINKDDLYLFFDLVMTENQITVEQTQEFLAKLPEDKLSILKGFAEDKFPKKEETADDIKKAELNEINLRNSAQRPSAINACDPSAQTKGFCWQQFIEYHQSGSVSSNVGASWHQRYTTICDDDASDTDLVVFFNVPSNNPDKIRWRTTSERIALYAVLTSNMSLNGFDFDNQGVHLCIGNGIAEQIGDDNFIKNNITIISVP